MDNVEMLFENPQENSLSLKLRYYLDYQYLKRKMIKANNIQKSYGDLRVLKGVNLEIKKEKSFQS